MQYIQCTLDSEIGSNVHACIDNADEYELFIRPFVIQSVYMYMYIQLTTVYMESRGPVNVHVHVYV